KGSGVPNTDKVGRLTTKQVRGIAQEKLEDLNAGSVEAAMKIIEGTARSMGVTVSDEPVADEPTAQEPQE
ncbi:MAG: hypothetical protein IH804_07815, partial [Planctomycetes bacterium]|nr:hypothetical protein [Planctomycetota bacterium]